jgi:hypothetical protein
MNVFYFFQINAKVVPYSLIFLRKMSTFRTCPAFFLLSDFLFFRFGGAKLLTLFLSCKYFLIFFKKYFLLSFLPFPLYSKNGRAKVHTLPVFSKYFFLLIKKISSLSSLLNNNTQKTGAQIYTLFIYLQNKI